MPEDDVADGSTLAETIERTRGRARALSGLVATATGAVIAGILFSPAGLDFGVAASVLSGVAVALFLICLSFLVYAQVVTKVSDQPSVPATDDERALRSVRNRTRDGLIVGVVALGTISATLVVVLTQRLTQERDVDLTISDSGLTRARAVCPSIGQSFVGTVDGELGKALRNDLLEVEVSAAVCGTKSAVTLVIPSSLVVGWSER